MCFSLFLKFLPNGLSSLILIFTRQSSFDIYLIIIDHLLNKLDLPDVKVINIFEKKLYLSLAGIPYKGVTFLQQTMIFKSGRCKSVKYFGQTTIFKSGRCKRVKYLQQSMVFQSGRCKSIKICLQRTMVTLSHAILAW